MAFPVNRFSNLVYVEKPTLFLEFHGTSAGMREQGESMADLCREHGTGLGKRLYLRAEHGEGVEVMRAIKNALGSKGIINPGKLL